MSVATLRAGDVVAAVDTDAGGRLVSLAVDGLELVGGVGADPLAYGWYPMAPWAGRLRANEVVGADGTRHALPATFGGWAIHGTLLAGAWQVDHVDRGSVRLSAALGPPWPWPGRATLSWVLGGKELTSQLAVHADAEPFPVVVGWHPWLARRLARGGDVELDVPATLMAERGADHLPTGRAVAVPAAGPFDDAFAVPVGAPVRAVWPGALTLTTTSSTPWYVIYTGADDAVAVEPQTAPPGCFDAPVAGSGPGWAAPGVPVSAWARWVWEAAGAP